MTSSKVTDTVDPQTALRKLQDSRGVSLDADCVDALVDTLEPRIETIPLVDVDR